MHRNAAWPEGELLAFDLETTGTDPFFDVPVSFALVTAQRGSVVHRRAGLVDPGRPIPQGATAVHGITDDRARGFGRPLKTAVEAMADALVEASERGVPLVGMKLDYDLTMLDVQCRRLDGRGLLDRGFTSPVFDTLVLDRHFDRYRRGHRTLSHLCQHYRVAIANAHDAAADAEATLGVLFALCRAFPELSARSPADLHRDQVQWHRAWTVSFEAWCKKKGMPLDPNEFGWPLVEECVVRGAA